MNTAYQNLVLLLASLSERDDTVVWIRTPDYREQLYVSRAFRHIWGRDPKVLYDDPLRWTEFLIKDERTDKIFELCARNPYSLDMNRNTTYYRISQPSGNIKHLRDTCFTITNQEDTSIAIAGIAVLLDPLTWERELENIANNTDDSDEKRIYEVLKAQHGDLLNFPNANPADSLPMHYIFLQTGDHVGLSSQEFRCLKGLLQGYTSKEIGKKLELSNRTVEFYISNLKQKLKFRKISELFSIIHPSSQMSLVE